MRGPYHLYPNAEHSFIENPELGSWQFVPPFYLGLNPSRNGASLRWKESLLMLQSGQKRRSAVWEVGASDPKQRDSQPHLGRTWMICW